MEKNFLSSLSALFCLCYAAHAVSAPPHWDYDDPAAWWALEDVTLPVPLSYPYAECGVGQHQSPVDLGEAQFVSKNLNQLAAEYGTDTITFFNSGHAVQVNTSIGYPGGLKVGEETLPLIQFHFHEPSEHVINGQHFPAEAHFVHITEDGRIAVLAVAIQLGEAHSGFQTVLDNTPVVGEERSDDTGIQLDPAAFLPQQDHSNLEYFTLAGSLTTPPCSEGVQWYLLADPITISEAQLEQFKSFYSDNARLAQDLNGRAILTSP
ncbi:carbonic anhydrase [Nitrosomonas sp. Nm51]|uniref:carbonic anhydrase n=1 Tax=Nitrosomonas sp. Nm51 TaxID=133720 RepID=UPI0008B5E612|nr:carbonic anhydrase family protein [Nitrosomonas sp. Nm51]SER62374.1 carbonic anhydrase [Nitrosomonas sp. Nm51]